MAKNKNNDSFGFVIKNWQLIAFLVSIVITATTGYFAVRNEIETNKQEVQEIQDEFYEYIYDNGTATLNSLQKHDDNPIVFPEYQLWLSAEQEKHNLYILIEYFRKTKPAGYTDIKTSCEKSEIKEWLIDDFNSFAKDVCNTII